MSPSQPPSRDTQRITVRERRADRHTAPEKPRPAAGVSSSWALQCHVAGHVSIQRTPLVPLPFRVGRASGLPMVLSSNHVSKNHAEIYSDGLTLRVRDLGSRNGTYLNRQLVADAPLHENDLLRIGDCDFRIVRLAPEGVSAFDTVPLRGHLEPIRVRELIDRGAVTAVYQPIVRLPGREPEAFEALGRGIYPGLPENPVELFDVAGVLGPDVQAELSALFRRRAVELVAGVTPAPLLFLNTHPADFEVPGLMESLEQVRAIAPDVRLVLEIHESVLGQIEFLSWLTTRLAQIQVGIAYDDFGAGEARLFELAEVPPDYLKFDRRFVDGIHCAPVSRQRLLSSLVAAARELQVATVAEGVDDERDAELCLRAGFTHGQGFYYGPPRPLDLGGAAPPPPDPPLAPRE
jgi:EAL domain-containing protein (putative c-di-GMP-specific phosphodiesterase class I)